MAEYTQKLEQISGIFNSRRALEDLFGTFNRLGIREDDVSILMSERTRDLHYGISDTTKLPEGASIGALSGGLLGAVLGGLTVIGNVLLPGIGLLVAGPLVGALAGGAVGSAAGGLIGALIGSGIPEHEAKFFEDALKIEGNILVVAQVPKGQVKEVKAIFERHGAHHIKVHS